MDSSVKIDFDNADNELQTELKAILESNKNFIRPFIDQNKKLNQKSFINAIKTDEKKKEEMISNLKQLDEMQKKINEFNQKNSNNQIQNTKISKYTNLYNDVANTIQNPPQQLKKPQQQKRNKTQDATPPTDDQKIKLDFDNNKDYKKTLDDINNQPPIEIKKDKNDEEKTPSDKIKDSALTALKALAVTALVGGSIAAITVGGIMLNGVIVGGIVVGSIVTVIGAVCLIALVLYVASKLDEKWKEGTEKTIERGQAKRREHGQSIDNAIKNVNWNDNQKKILNKIEKDLKADIGNKYQGKLEAKIKNLDEKIKKMKSSAKPLTKKQEMELNKLKLDKADLEEQLSVVKILNHYRKEGVDINPHPKTISIDPLQQNEQKTIRITPESQLNKMPSQAPIQPDPNSKLDKTELKKSLDNKRNIDEEDCKIEDENTSQEIPQSNIPTKIGREAQKLVKEMQTKEPTAKKPYISKGGQSSINQSSISL